MILNDDRLVLGSAAIAAADAGIEIGTEAGIGGGTLTGCPNT